MSAFSELERQRQALQEELDAGKTQAERNRLGQFSTPPELASEMVKHALAMLPPRSSVRFLEPGFGTGPFYSALLHLCPSSRIDTAKGFEIDPHCADRTKPLWRGTGLRLATEDFTKAEPPKSEDAKYNLVISNPPYVRHHHLGQSQKAELKSAVARHTGVWMNGLSGLYTYFLALSRAWMRQGGVGAWLIPSEFMDVNYGRQVKEFLLRRVTLHRLHRFDPKEAQFGDALVSSAVVFFRNTPPPDKHRVRFSFGGTVTRPEVAETIETGELGEITKWTCLPVRTAGPVRKHGGDTLADLFAVKRGLATGCNSFFILTPDQIADWELPQAFLVPILPSPKDLETDEIASDRNGIPKIRKRLFLLDCDVPEEEVQRRHPRLWEYLRRGMEAGIHERYLCRRRDPWYSQEKRPAAPFLCTYMGRATKRGDLPFRFILNHSKATAANVYLMLYPKPPLASILAGEPDAAKSVWRALCTISSEMLTGEGRVYGGGLHKLEPKELANVPADLILGILPGAKVEPHLAALDQRFCEACSGRSLWTR